MVTRRTLLLRSALIVGSAALPQSLMAAPRVTSNLRGVADPRGASNSVMQSNGQRIRRCVLDGTLDFDGYYRRWARAAGMRVDEYQRDVGALSMQIAAAWSADRVAIAGVTLESSLGILEHHALRHGLWVSSIAEHSRQRDGDWRHVLVHGSASVDAHSVWPLPAPQRPRSAPGRYLTWTIGPA